MANILSYSPGQTATIFLQVLDSDGVRVDDGYTPVVTQIITPEFTIYQWPQPPCPPPCSPLYPLPSPPFPYHPHPQYPQPPYPNPPFFHRDHDWHEHEHEHEHHHHDGCPPPPPEPTTYPVNMTEFSTGLWYFQFVIPKGAISVGTYLIDVAYLNASDGYVNNEIFQIVVNAPFGNYGTTTY